MSLTRTGFQSQSVGPPPELGVGVLGPLVVRVGGAEQALGGPAPRALVQRLVVAGGDMVPASVLVDDVWSDDAPPSAMATLHTYVSRLRRVIEPDRSSRESSRVLVRQGSGYALWLPPGALDADRFVSLAGLGRDRLAGGDAEGAFVAVDEALGLWRGPAYVECADRDFARPEAHRLDDLRVSTSENRLAAMLELGEHEAAGAALEAYTEAYPLRERGWELLALALYRQGRQGDALGALRSARQHIADELGVDPGSGMLALQAAILSQDPALLAPPARTTASAGSMSAGIASAGIAAGMVPAEALTGAAPLAPVGERDRSPAPTASDPSVIDLSAVHSNLPARLSSLVGRAEELRAVDRLLRRHRLVTLIGAGGMGKTRLALEVARARDDSDGPWLVELAGLHEPALLAEAVAKAVGVVAAGASTLAHVLRERRTVLVLDNCEHLVEQVAPLVEELLGACPDLRVLATSREALGAEGEIPYELPPLSIGEDGEAVRLFLDRAAVAAPDWSPAADEQPLVAQLCADLDGMPLAIELAAAQCKVLSLRQISERLDDRFTLLRGGRRANTRHATMLAAVEWSYELLTSEEREVFQALAVFEGGFVLDAARAVTGRDDILVHLTSLVAKSLVVVVGGDPRRYRILETLRQYAAQRTDPARRADLVRRHVAWVRSLSDVTGSALLGMDWTRRLNDEGANIRAALDNAGDPATVLHIATGFYWFWYREGHVAEGLRYLEPSLMYWDGEECPGVPDRAIPDRAIPDRAVPDHATRARAAIGLALLYYLAGALDKVVDALQRAGGHAARSEDPTATAQVLATVAYFEARSGQIPAARQHAGLDRESAAQLRATLDPLMAPRTALPAPGGSSGSEAGPGPDLRTPGQRRADALVEVCRIAMACGQLPDNGGDRPQVVVTVDLDTLRTQVGAATLDDGSLLSAGAARRLACDAAILPAVLGSAGQVLDVGQQRRLFTGSLRKALILRDRGCAFPGCDRPPRWADGHHIVHWAAGGKTSLDNEVLLCGYHHRLIHHSPWQVRLNPTDGLPEFIPPAYVDPEQHPQRNRYHRRE